MKLKRISMNKIMLSKGKRQFNEGEVFALAKSIALCGMLSPITVRQIPLSDRYEIIMGIKRFYAHRLLGLKDITALIINADPSFSRAVLKKGDFKDVFEKADSIACAIRNAKLTTEEMASRSGYSEKEITSAMKISNMTELERETVRINEIPDSIVSEVAVLEDSRKRTAILSECIRKRLKLSEVNTLCEKERLGGRIISKSTAQRTVKFKDLRLFDNTLSRALSLLKSAGIDAEMKTEEGKDSTEYKIKIHSSR